MAAPTDTQTSNRETQDPHLAGARGEPPRWPLEKAIETVGGVPAALKRLLDRLAGVPVLGRVVRFFSSVWLGLLWIGLIGLYVAVGSGFPSVRARYELTDLQFFDAWPMQLLLLLMCTTLIVVTLRRIPLTLFKLGVWTVHTGILVLVLGCIVYFSQKVEGLTRIHLGKTSSTFYDATERAIYIYRVGDRGALSHEEIVRVPGMPIYHEHLSQFGNALSLPLDQPAVSRVSQRIAGARVTGYYPYAVMRENLWGPGPELGTTRKPGVAVAMGRGPLGLEQAVWLADSPAARVFDNEEARMVLEYLYRPTPERVRELSETFNGRFALTVRVPKFNVERTYTFDSEKDIPIEGTPYVVKPLGPRPAMSMASPGYEGSSSSGFSFEVRRTDVATQPTTTTAPATSAPDPAASKPPLFTRHVLTRFPELSPDFLVIDGKPKRFQARVDQDIDLVFHDATRDQLTVVQPQETGDTFTLIHRQRGGTTTSKTFKLKEPTELTIAGRVPMTLVVAGYTSNAVPAPTPVIVPQAQRRRATTVGEIIQRGVAELTVDVVGEGGKVTPRVVYAPFTSFADTTPPRGQKPAVVDLPGGERVGFVLSTTRHPLPTTLRLDHFELKLQKNARQVPQDYISTLTAVGAADQGRRLVTQLNSPAEYGGLYFFQAQWDGNPDATPEERFTVLGVGNRPGVYIMTAGCLLILLGVLYAFYVKPVLLKAKRDQLAAWSAAR